MKIAKYNETEIVKLMFGILTYHQIPVRHLLCLNHPMKKLPVGPPPPPHALDGEKEEILDF